MSILNRKESFILGLGDVLVFLFALWLTLVFRYGTMPTGSVFYAHLVPFSVLFVAWLIVFFIAGLYEKHTLLLRSRLSGILLRAVITNSILAVIFFYFIPYFGISPKANLFIYLLFSFGLILSWRVYGLRFFNVKHKQDAIIIGTGKELVELTEEVNRNPRYGIRFLASIEVDKLAGLDFEQIIIKRIKAEQVTLVALDIKNKKIEPLLPHFYNLLFKHVQFVDIYKLYEDIFDRIPLSLIKYDWFLEHVFILPSSGYDALKRLMDIILSIIGGGLSLIFYPLIIALIKLDDGGPIFIFQERVGVQNKTIKIVKFRTMMRDDAGLVSAQKNNKPTRVGPFLRRSRLDELPQFFNVLRGDLSLVGPRPELPSLVSVYEKEVLYYNVRHLIKPGLFGWAQLYHEKHPHHIADISETRVKLSYDLYYIKNRSFFLDLKIALKTLKTILSRSGV